MSLTPFSYLLIVGLIIYTFLVVRMLLNLWKLYRKSVSNVKLVFLGDKSIEQHLAQIPVKLQESSINHLRYDFSLIEGALKFWKLQVERTDAAHRYSVFWSTANTAMIPILSALLGTDDPVLKFAIFLLSAHSGLIIFFHSVYKPDTKWKTARECESAYYDLFRTMTQMPLQLGATEDEQIQEFLRRSQAIRQQNREKEKDSVPQLQQQQPKPN